MNPEQNAHVYVKYPYRVEARTNVLYNDEFGIQNVRLFDPDNDDPYDVEIIYSLYVLDEDEISHWLADTGYLDIAELFMFKLAKWYGCPYNDSYLVDPYESRCNDG
jgi:hypothetical protein